MSTCKSLFPRGKTTNPDFDWEEWLEYVGGEGAVEDGLEVPNRRQRSIFDNRHEWEWLSQPARHGQKKGGDR